MATITEDYCDFETSKLLKEKGFNESLLTFYVTDKEQKEGSFEIMAFTDDKITNNTSKHCIVCPTLQMACKWLRLVHNIHVSAEPWYKEDENLEDVTLSGWGYEIHNLKTNGLIHEGFEDKLYDNPEQACEAACIYVLKNLI